MSKNCPMLLLIREFLSNTSWDVRRIWNSWKLILKSSRLSLSRPKLYTQVRKVVNSSESLALNLWQQQRSNKWKRMPTSESYIKELHQIQQLCFRKVNLRIPYSTMTCGQVTWINNLNNKNMRNNSRSSTWKINV